MEKKENVKDNDDKILDMAHNLGQQIRVYNEDCFFPLAYLAGNLLIAANAYKENFEKYRTALRNTLNMSLEIQEDIKDKVAEANADKTVKDYFQKKLKIMHDFAKKNYNFTERVQLQKYYSSDYFLSLCNSDYLLSLCKDLKKEINQLKLENEKLKQRLKLKPISVVGAQQNKNNGSVKVSSEIERHETTKTPSSVNRMIANKIESLVNDSLHWCNIEQFDSCFRMNKQYEAVRESNKPHGKNKLNCKSITDCKNFADIYSYLCILGYNDKPKLNSQPGSYISKMTKKDGFEELCKKVFNVKNISNLEAQKQSTIETIGTLMYNISLDKTKESKLMAFTKLTNEELENDKQSIEKVLNACQLPFEVRQFLQGNKITNDLNTRGKTYLSKIGNHNKKGISNYNRSSGKKVSNNKGAKYYFKRNYRNSAIAKK